MKRKILVPCFSSLLLLVSTIGISDVVAAWLPPANTDVCWGTATQTIRLRFINKGGGYYQLVGKETGAGYKPMAIFGTAVLNAPNDTNIYMTLTISGINADEIWNATSPAVLNRSTLSVTAKKTIGVSHSLTDPDPNNASAWADGPSTLKHITCP